ENVQHLLALSYILLLKPGRTHMDIPEHITFNQCENLLIYIQKSNSIIDQMLPCSTKEKLEGIVHNLVYNVSNVSSCTDSGQSSRLVVSWKIAALIEEDPTFNSTNRILLVIRKIAEVLPRFIIEDGPQETELITQYLHPALVPLFENIDERILFQW
ncbi:hypothetical protein J3Q64DRAFT_1643469, partial [Phycomyces blakesleeanus]